MKRNGIFTRFGVILAAGSIWGLVEFAAGLGLQKCAALYTGAILTGLSFFWLTFVWGVTGRILPVIQTVVIVMLFKWLDAFLLQLEWNNGAVVNPMFAFLTAMTGFILVITLFRKRFTGKLSIRILSGGLAALTAMALFPLVRFATGIPACTYAATQVPLSVYTAPAAMVIAMITVPLGFKVSLWFDRMDDRVSVLQSKLFIGRLWSLAVFISCVIIIIMARSI
jgi:hypothetical protein